MEEERTVLSVIQWGAAQLSTRGFEDARLNVELLLSHSLGTRAAGLHGILDRRVTSEEFDRFLQLLQRRLRHEPLQYITGEAEFMGITLSVNKQVLIPRPETELLVERALSIIKTIRKETIQVLDIGTGSGNIPIAIASFAPAVSVTSIDVSQGALETAARNAARHSISSVMFRHADVFAEFPPGQQFDVIVSNPPYISRDDFALLEPEVREFEPAIATTGGEDGLRFLRRISELSAGKLYAGGWLLMELSYDQSVEAVEILRNKGLSNVELFDDYQGIPRIIQAQVPISAGTMV